MSFGIDADKIAEMVQSTSVEYTYYLTTWEHTPSNISALRQEIATLHNSLKVLEEEARGPYSALVHPRGIRVRMVGYIMHQVDGVLQKLGKAYPKRRSPNFRPLDMAQDELYHKFVDLNQLISRKLPLSGNIAARRLGQVAWKVDRINEYTKRMIWGDEVLRRFLDANCEGLTDISIDAWVEMSRRSLSKSQMSLYTGLPPNQKVSQQGYEDLIKASWVLTDMIIKHPELDFLKTSIVHDAELLAETIWKELQNIDASCLSKPRISRYACELDIEELREINLQLGEEEAGKRNIRNREMAAEHEYVIFQRSVYYQLDRVTEPILCVLYLIHKKDKEVGIVLKSQHGGHFEIYPVGRISLCSNGKALKIEPKEILFSVPEEAAEEYLLYCKKYDNNPETLQAFALLFAIKNNYTVVVEQLFGDDQPTEQLELSLRPSTDPSAKIQLATKKLALGYIKGVHGDSRYNNTGNNKYKDPENYISLFLWAIKEGYNVVAALLLEFKGIVMDQEDIHTYSSIQDAARHGSFELVSLCLSKHGVDIDNEDVNGWTALELAIWNGHDEVVKKLLETGAVLVDRYHESLTGLQVAASRGHLAIVNSLLDNYTDVNAPAGDRAGYTALQAAAGGGHIDVVNRLLEARADVNDLPAKWGGGHTALQAAAGGGHMNIVDRLLEVGADANTPASYSDGRTALQAAASGGHIDVVNKLLEAGADINGQAAHSGGGTALQLAAGGGHMNVVNRLLEDGADINAEAAPYRGRTALQAAAGGGHIDVVNKLLDVGADINDEAAYSDGRTALQAAAGGGHISVVNKLLEVGADVNAPAERHGGCSALQAAAGAGHIHVVDKLLEAGAYVNIHVKYDGRCTALQAAASGGYIDVVDRLLEAGADVNAQTKYSTALQAAASRGHIDVVDRLLEAGADVNTSIKYGDGHSAFQAAIDGGHVGVADRLREAGAGASDEATHNGRYTALKAAAAGGYMDVVNRLLEAGADVNAGKYDTALQVAADIEHIEVADTLPEDNMTGRCEVDDLI